MEDDENELQFYRGLFTADLKKFKEAIRLLDYSERRTRSVIHGQTLEFLDAYYMYYEDEIKVELLMFIEYAWSTEHYKSMGYFIQKCIDNDTINDIVVTQLNTIKDQDELIKQKDETLERIKSNVLKVAEKYQHRGCGRIYSKNASDATDGIVRDISKALENE